MTRPEREAAEAEALLTDLYLDALLARAIVDPGASGAPEDRLDPALRQASDRLRRDLVRVHPSFRFEERLATRLAEAAAALRMPQAVGAEGSLVQLGVAGPGSGPSPFGEPLDYDPLATDDPDAEARDLSRPLLIGGALTSAALSIAGAAWVAWRRTRPARAGSPMARAARAVREARRSATIAGGPH